MNEPITVEPDYTKSGIEASETFKNRVSDAGAKYPLSIGGHSIRVVYTFEKDKGGLLKLMGLGYYCLDCEEQKNIEGDKLWTYENNVMKLSREYMLGHFFETDC